MDDLSIFEKGVFHLMNGIDKVNTEIRNRTGFDCIKKLGESEIKDKKLKKEHYGRWVAKHLTIGTLTGLFGASIHSKVSSQKLAHN